MIRSDLITAKSSLMMDATSSLEFFQVVWFYPFLFPAFYLLGGMVKLHFSNLLFKWKRLLPRGTNFIFPCHLQIKLVSSVFIPTETMLSPGTSTLQSKCNWSFHHELTKKDICIVLLIPLLSHWLTKIIEFGTFFLKQLFTYSFTVLS